MTSKELIHDVLHKITAVHNQLTEVLVEIDKAGDEVIKESTPELSWSQKEKIRQALWSFYDTAYYHGTRQMGKYQEDSVVAPLERIGKIVGEG